MNLLDVYKRQVLGYPEIIILDEPTVGLDPKQIIEIRELIRHLGEKHTVILSSHILPEISAVCDHVFIISKGKLVAVSYTHLDVYKRQAVLRAKEVVLKTATKVQENAEDIYAEAKQINEDRAAKEEEVFDGEEVTEETTAEETETTEETAEA